jgi:hypothetical protein
MEKSKMYFLSILHGTPPSKNMCSKTQIEIYIYDGNGILYLAIGFINREDKLEVQNCLN